MRGIASWLLSPTEPSERGRRIALAGLRILAGALWLYNVVWKLPPDFGRARGADLFRYVQGAVDKPFLPPYSWLLEKVVLPNFSFFGWGVLVVESLLAAFLLAGVFTRLWALIGVGQALAIGLSVITAPGEWPWAYFMLIGLHLVLFATAAGAYGGIDGIRARGGGEAAWRGLSVAGAVTTVVAAVSLVFALMVPPLASPGSGLRSGELEVSLGRYNLLGALLLLGLGVLLLVAGRARSRAMALTSAALAVVATLSIWLQLGSGDVLLGADGTAAAVYLTVAVAAASLTVLTDADRPAPSPATGQDPTRQDATRQDATRPDLPRRDATTRGATTTRPGS